MLNCIERFARVKQSMSDATPTSNRYLDLLTSVGIPNILNAKTNIQYEDALMDLASLNKIELLYAQLTRSKQEEHLNQKYNETLNTIIEISNAFDDQSLNYAIFKTIKPFPHTPSDIDILIAYNHLERAKAILSHRCYRSISKDNFCITMYKDMNVDLYLEPSVANLPYLRSSILMQEKKTALFCRSYVTTLSNEAEFIAVACHSFCKEQMFTLNDFITLALLAEGAHISKIIAISNELNVIGAILPVLGLCRCIADQLTTVLKLSILFDELDIPKISPIIMPYKFSTGTVSKMIFKKIVYDRQTRRYFPRAVISNLSINQVKKFIEHMRRASY